MASHSPLKQRIVGAIVLISLAVIFFPMMLDGRGPQQTIRHTNIPPDTDGAIDAIEFQLDADKPDASAPEEGTVPFLKDLFQGFRLFRMTESEEPEPAPPPAPTEPPAQAWMVQLAAFRDRDKAEKLRDRLRAEDYPAFVKSSEGGLWVVRVGPELSAEAARTLRARLAKDTGLDPMVVGHIP